MQSPFGALRHHLPPAERWDYKDMKGSLLIVDSTVLLYRWRQPPKRGGMHFLARRAVVKVLYKLAPSINLEAPSTTLSGIAAVSRVDGIRLLCPPLTEPYVRFSRIRLLE